MTAQVTGRMLRVALAAGLLATFVGCSESTELKGDPTVKAEQGKSVEESTKKGGRVIKGAPKDAAPTQRKSGGPE
jgi:hypothetical protein